MAIPTSTFVYDVVSKGTGAPLCDPYVVAGSRIHAYSHGPERSFEIEGDIVTSMKAHGLLESEAEVECRWADVGAGMHFPRIHRPTSHFDGRRPVPCAETVLDAARQVELLLHMLDQILRFVTPHVDNFTSFGPEIRSLLLLSSMEFEAQYRGVLAENSHRKFRGTASTGKPRINIEDFCELAVPMRLGDRGVLLRRHPTLGYIAPFSDWKAPKTPKSPEWYRAYNATKHDRRFNEHQGSLGHAIQAVAAVCVMLSAQFGHDHVASNVILPLMDIGFPPAQGMSDYYYCTGQSWETVPYFEFKELPRLPPPGQAVTQIDR